MKRTRSKSTEMRKYMHMLAILLVPAVALILGAAAPEGWAEDELEFEDAQFNIEFNSSDEDLGVRGFVDGEPWKEVEIEDPKGLIIAEVEAQKSMAKQGFAELFFESGEPTLEEVSIKTFLQRFPEGTYKFEGETIEGDEIQGEAEFTHVIPCGPTGLSATGNPIVISWDFVTQVVDLDNTTFENVLCKGSGDLEIVAYRVEAEWEDADGVVHRFGIDLKADQNSVTVPPQFIPPGQDYQFEVLAIEDSGNQTITEEEATAP